MNLVPKSPKWNTANLVTLSRIAVTPVFLVFIFRPEYWAKWVAGLLFAWGAISDWLDGYLARRYNLRTDLGALLDPLADKILILSVLVSFVQLDLVPSWMVVIIAAREFLITGLRQVAKERGVILAASRGGKHKTVSQIVAISFVLLIVCVRATVEAGGDRWYEFLARLGSLGDALQEVVGYGPYWLMFYATVMSLVSGADYFLRNRHILGGGRK